MDSPQYLRHFVHLTINGTADQALPVYELTEKDYQHLARYIALTPSERAQFLSYQCPSFLWLETVEGINLLAAEEDIDILRLFTQASPTPPPQPPQDPDDFASDEDWEPYEASYDHTIGRGQVEVYLRGRSKRIITSTLDNAAEFAQYFPVMDDPDALEPYIAEEGEFIFFTDDNGEEVGIRLDQLMLLVAHPGSADFEYEKEF